MNYIFTSRNGKTILAIFLAVTAANFCFAQEAEPIETDRPSATQSPKVVPHKTVQLEAGVLFTKDSEQGAEVTRITYPSALLRIGVLKWAELRASGFNREHAALEFAGNKFTSDGFGPVSVGTKVQLFSQKGIRPQAALTAEVELPSGTEAFKTNDAEPKLSLALGNQLNDKLTLNYTLGYKFNDLDENDYQYGIGLQAKVTEKISVYGEVFGGKTKSNPFQHSADAGLLVQVLDNLQIDIAAGTGITQITPDLLITTGLSFRIPD